MAITITQLTAFLAVIRGGSVTAAADELVVTQPSVSAAVAALGRELRCELFERVGRGIRPTEAGAAFAPYAADVIGLLEQGRQAAREAAAGAARRLRIAAVTTAAESFVPPLMRAFSDAHPDVELILHVGNRGDVLRWVLDHTVDVAISGRPPADERLTADPGVGPVGPRLAAARGRLGHPRAQRPVPRRAQPRGANPHAGVQRRHQAGRARRPRRLAVVARRGRDRARSGAAR